MAHGEIDQHAMAQHDAGRVSSYRIRHIGEVLDFHTRLFSFCSRIVCQSFRDVGAAVFKI
jgi:hypothetical protein